ncbi:MAG: helix-turn-helix domain-containing protein [Bacteroidetes bacterium]|nr:helix-turn-helix domain-containing protein [Bacteroidota bacterium]
MNFYSYMRPKEAASYLGISINTIYKLIFEKKIKYSKPNGKVVLFKKEDLDEFVRSGEIEIRNQ